ncbi:24511_t:CDS:2 [Dentiscutata erythropus]|uniref:24511_t:CDS:1 n=1 Tax=Dentiscutata erythropus TaxID=1348616 RepID=A0A9N9B4E6_9GLOM|nr:24511_t:CDS:2 [Dentiscutata erythropus]
MELEEVDLIKELYSASIGQISSEVFLNNEFNKEEDDLFLIKGVVGFSGSKLRFLNLGSRIVAIYLSTPGSSQQFPNESSISSHTS